MKETCWIVALAVAAQTVACSPRFTCEASRTCAPSGGSANEDGSSGEGGGDPGDGSSAGDTWAGGSAGNGESGNTGIAGVSGIGGAPGACAADEKRCPDGSCVKLTDPADGCGASSCITCPVLTGADAICYAGSCAIGPCLSGFSNCDSQPDCETDIRQRSHCGGCTTSCGGATPVCAASGSGYACASGCATGEVLCNGTCTDTTADVANCNACGTVCTTPNGTPKCSAGKCSPASCVSGYSVCGTSCAYTDGDAQNCGDCNLKCPSGSLCKSGSCEVRVGYPTIFTGNEANAFRAMSNFAQALPITVTKQSTLLALGLVNTSTSAGTVASFGLYADNGTKGPGALVVSAPSIALKDSVQEIAVSNVVLVPGTYYFAILARDDGAPTIPTSLNSNPSIESWIGGHSFGAGLPADFGSIATEVFPSNAINVYVVVKQSGG